MEERGLRCRCLVPWLAARSKLEMLGTKNLLKNRRLARAISDAGFGEFIRSHVGIQGPVAWKNARQSREVLPVIKVVLHLSPKEGRPQTPRPLDVFELPYGTSAGRECRRKHFRRRFENLSRGTLGISLWRHSRT